MRTLPLAAFGIAACWAGAAWAASADVTGAWQVHADQGDAVISADLDLAAANGGYTGRSGALDTFGACPLTFRGTLANGRLHLTASAAGKDVGTLDLTTRTGRLEGSGVLFGAPVTISGERPPRPPGAPRTYDVEPTRFHVLSSGVPAPIRRLFPGDTVRTRTVDAYGTDEKGAAAGMPGNAGTGPFFIEGAMPGDTLAVHILSLKPNRATARMNPLLDPRALPQGYTQTRPPGRTDVWRLDPATGQARPEAPSERLKDFAVPLQPMLGVIAVAPPAGLSAPNSDLGEWGGNLDNPEAREGATVYLPVWAAGAMLYVGDAHARQGDGEIAGQGLETSMAVEFRVELIKHDSLGQPWTESADAVMVSGIGGSLNDALERATAGLARWLKARYQLDDADVAVVLGSSIRYQVAEVVDPKFHVAARIDKAVLARIAPAKP